MSKSTSNGPVLCYGEVLWDSIPQGLFPGGAPMNVAYHLSCLGVTALPVTAIGKDFLGEELIRRMKDWGLNTEFVGRVDSRPTGLVRVTLQEGKPTFDIVQDVAWDYIQLPDKLLDRASQARALVYGSLAQRSDHNRRNLQKLVQTCEKALKVFDVNMRPPFDQAKRMWELSKMADLIKMNDEELDKLLEEKVEHEALEEGVREFSERSGCQQVCVTSGPRGAGLLLGEEWFWANGKQVEVKDTIGAGDSFLAALVKGLMDARDNPQKVLERSCRLAEFVATCSGATPFYQLTGDWEIRPV